MKIINHKHGRTIDEYEIAFTQEGENVKFSKLSDDEIRRFCNNSILDCKRYDPLTAEITLTSDHVSGGLDNFGGTIIRETTYKVTVYTD